MAYQQTFDVNGRHVMNVIFNGASGLCDVVVSEKQTNRTFIKSMVLAQYNQLVDWLRENDHGFAMMSVRAIF
jgi:pantothenate kinase